MTTVIPSLCIKDAARAVAFYTRAFDAVESPGRITDSTGRIGHTELRIGDSKVYVPTSTPSTGSVAR